MRVSEIRVKRIRVNQGLGVPKKYMLCKKFYNLVYFTTTTLYKSKQMSCDNSVDLRLQTLDDWVKLHIIKIILLILENIFQFFRLSKIKS